MTSSPVPPSLRVAVVGAGFAGLSTAKVLTAAGHAVTVYERAPDVGGVWSRTRRYPGLSTQNGKDTYAFSDFPMPRHYPEWPSGEQVQEYLHAYAVRTGVLARVRLQTEVVAAGLDESAGTWTLRTRDVTSGADAEPETFDHLVVANGIFSEPVVPEWPGSAEFTAAGGRLCHTSELSDVEPARGRDVVVVGYGKSSCDVAVALSEVAASTSVVARELLWKIPRKLGNVLNYKYLLLTRLGEGLFRYITPVGFERFLHGPGQPVRDSMLGSVQSVIERQLGLRRIGLLPEGSLERVARSTVSLVTDGFFEKAADDTIRVHRDMQIARLRDHDGRPAVELADGTVLPADLVVCGTGFTQRVPFLDDAMQARLHDERGNFTLYRQILPHDVPRLTFSGYNSSLFSPLSAEIAAVWTARHLRGDLPLPPVEERRRQVAARLRWMEHRTQGKHARGTTIIPFSMHNIDEMLDDMGVGIGRAARAVEWLLPLRPGAYAKITRGLAGLTPAWAR
jgi:dimethylaniline monooxygenase (N-oxide forming)